MKKNKIINSIAIAIFVILSVVITGKHMPVSLEIDVAAPAADEYDLFYDIGKIKNGYRFNEIDKIGIYVTPKAGIATLRYNLPKQKINGIRLDPGTKKGRIGFCAIRLIKGKRIWREWGGREIQKYVHPGYEIGEVKIENSALVFNSLGEDPQLNIGKEIVDAINYASITPLGKLNYYAMALFLCLLIYFIMIMSSRLIEQNKRAYIIFPAILVVLLSLITIHKRGMELALDVKAENYNDFMLFYDVGCGFNEFDGSGAVINDGDGEYKRLIFKLPAGKVLGVRVDPGSMKGNIYLRSLSLIEKNEVICSWSPDQIIKDFNPALQIGQYIVEGDAVRVQSIGNDPQIKSFKPFIKNYSNGIRKINSFERKLPSYAIAILIVGILFLKRDNLQKALKRSLDASARLSVISGITLFGFIAAVIYHYYAGAYLNMTYPHNTFLFNPVDKFNDFYNQLKIVKNFNPYYETGGVEAVYFPFSYLIIYLYSLIRPFTLSLAVYSISFAVFVACYNYVNMKAKTDEIKNWIIMTLLTYPFLFSIDRANFENLLFVFMALFIYFYQKRKYLLSVLFLSCAVGMKLYPILFVLLFISDKKYKEVVYVLVLSLLMTLVSMIVLKGGFVASMNGVLNGLEYHKINYGIGDAGLHYNSSIYGMIKAIIYEYFEPVFIGDRQNVHLFYNIYFKGCIIIAAGISLFMIMYRQEFWEKVAVITLIQLLLPYMTGDYKLIHLLIPMFLFIQTSKLTKNDLLYAILFGILLIPKNYYYLFDDVSASVIINPLLMTAMLVMILVKNIKKRGAERVRLE